MDPNIFGQVGQVLFVVVVEKGLVVVVEKGRSSVI
jgi:hypothetical protein